MVGDVREWRPGFYTEVRYESRERSGLAWKAMSEKVTKSTEMHNIQTKKKRYVPNTRHVPIRVKANAFQNLPPQHKSMIVMGLSVDFYPNL